jgi:hypothetical protein
VVLLFVQLDLIVLVDKFHVEYNHYQFPYYNLLDLVLFDANVVVDNDMMLLVVDNIVFEVELNSLMEMLINQNLDMDLILENLLVDYKMQAFDNLDLLYNQYEMFLLEYIDVDKVFVDNHKISFFSSSSYYV